MLRATRPRQAACSVITAVRSDTNLPRAAAMRHAVWMRSAAFCCRISRASLRASIARVHAYTHPEPSISHS